MKAYIYDTLGLLVSGCILIGLIKWVVYNLQPPTQPSHTVPYDFEIGATMLAQFLTQMTLSNIILLVLTWPVGIFFGMFSHRLADNVYLWIQSKALDHD